jgi:CRISPR-associated endonuclease/helicase Cas3
MGSEVLKAAHDPDLVLWLVGTHHGRGRPFFDPVDDPHPVVAEVMLDFMRDGHTTRLRGPVRHGLAELTSGWADRFDALLARYGHWGLAYLEAVVRLVDARRSRVAEAAMSDTQGYGLFDARGAA